jgi:hypothetical protein
MTSHLFMSPRLKVERAYRHIHELNHVLDEFLQTDFYTAGMEENPDTGRYTFRVSMASQLPAEIPLSMGDAVHNMRSALDHLAAGIVRRAGLSGKHTYFPFDEERQGLITRLNKGPIKQACPGIKDIIVDKVKSYRGGNTPLWELNKLDNIDKHNLLIPAIYNTHVSIDRLETEDGTIIEQSLVSVGPGGLLESFGFGQKVKIKGNVYPRFEVKFPKTLPFEDEPVVPTLAQCAGFVSQALDIIEEFITARAAADGASP